jgi:hypothetical protein
MTALDYAREIGDSPCAKMLEMAGYRNKIDRVMFSLHCSTVGHEDMAGEYSTFSPLRELYTDDRYRHLIEGMMGLVTGD